MPHLVHPIISLINWAKSWMCPQPIFLRWWMTCFTNYHLRYENILIVSWMTSLFLHMILKLIKVIKLFMFKLKEYGMLLTINKIHTFYLRWNIWVYYCPARTIYQWLYHWAHVWCCFHTPNHYYSQGNQVIHWMYYLFSTIPTYALWAYHAYKW